MNSSYEGNPISPDDINSLKAKNLPKEVFDGFNKLIVDNWNGRCAKFNQNEVAKLIASKMDISTNDVYEKKYLEVEDIYREKGWVVEYDKPGYCEDYNASFTFSKP